MLASRSLLCSLTSALRVNLRHKTPAYTASGVTRKYSRSIAPLRPSHLQAMAITGPAVTSSDLQSWFTNQDLRTAWGTPKGLPDPEHPGQLTVSSGAWGAYDLPGDPSAYLITHSGETTVVAFPGSHNYNDWVSDLTFKTVEITNGFIPAGTLQVNQRVCPLLVCNLILYLLALCISLAGLLQPSVMIAHTCRLHGMLSNAFVYGCNTIWYRMGDVVHVCVQSAILPMQRMCLTTVADQTVYLEKGLKDARDAS